MNDLFADELGSERDPLLSQRQCATLAGVSVTAFQNWGLQPVRTRGREKLYRWADVRDYLFKRRDRPSASADRAAADARLKTAQAELREMEIAERRGELTTTEAMGVVVGRMLTAFRARLLAVPSKCAPRANPGNPNVARDVIERELLDVLAELADFDPGASRGERRADGQGAARDPTPAAKADGKRVGGRRKKAVQRKQR